MVHCLPTLSIAAALSPLLAFAAPLYSSVDAQGVLHLSNLPPLSPAPPPARAPKHPQADANVLALITQTAAQFELDADLLHAMIQVESGYRPQARSEKGAIGLMQLMPQTASRFGALHPQDPAQNLAAAGRYLRWLSKRFAGDLTLTLAAYNAGEGAVARFGNQIPPYPETMRYVAKVLRHYRARSGDTLHAPERLVTVWRSAAPATTEGW